MFLLPRIQCCLTRLKWCCKFTILIRNLWNVQIAPNSSRLTINFLAVFNINYMASYEHLLFSVVKEKQFLNGEQPCLHVLLFSPCQHLCLEEGPSPQTIPQWEWIDLASAAIQWKTQIRFDKFIFLPTTLVFHIILHFTHFDHKWLQVKGRLAVIYFWWLA